MPKSIEQRFLDEFYQANPLVYWELLRLAQQAKAAGLTKIGIRMLWEVMRWNRLIAVKDPNDWGYKLNDHYHSRYARALINNNPDLADLFELGRLLETPG